LELDDTLAEAHVDMAIIHFWYEYDWNAAERVAEAAKTVRGLRWARVAELEMELNDKKIVAKWGVARYARSIPQ
jgi:hypothetical protein